MSTGLECDFYCHGGNWYYTLQDGNCPVQCWDWREYSTTYGPFPSYEVADEHLRNNHANPGGCSIINYDEIGQAPDEMVLKCISEAQNGDA